MIKSTRTTSVAVSVLLSAFYINNAHAQDTRLYWGDTHLHTSFSLDAYTLGNRTATPDTAYRFAKGLPVVHPGHKARVRIDRPLDFLAVTDHAEYMGIIPELDSGNEELLATELGKQYYKLLKGNKVNEMFLDMVDKASGDPKALAPLDSVSLRKNVWSRIVDTADAHYEPGKFTTFVGWEWSAMPNAANLHRIIFSPDGGDKAKSYLPFSLFDSQKPRDLWKWMAKTAKENDTDFIAIGHNMNLSLGRFFPEVDESGKPVDLAYARARERWEPVEEVTQFKGDSETHPILSPTDEYADFETYKHLLGTSQHGKNGPSNKAIVSEGSFMRSGLRRGLELEQKIGQNPYKFGAIGASDSHTALSSVEETNFLGKYASDSTPESKSQATTPGSVGWDASAQGLAAVWATGNSREEIAAAFQRKEVYATTGPRITLRVFGGWEFSKSDIKEHDLAAIGYRKGVPMGGDLLNAPKGGVLHLLIQAIQDPMSAKLQRVQVIKGWVDAGGKSHEKIFDAMVADNLKGDESIDLNTGKPTYDVGAVELATVWTDPEFNADLNAFYYVRVMEMPTARHTLFDTIAMKQDPAVSGHDAVIQERAYSTPIWYSAK